MELTIKGTPNEIATNMDEEVKDALVKQLQLLCERSQESHAANDLAILTKAMCKVAEQITLFPTASR